MRQLFSKSSLTDFAWCYSFLLTVLLTIRKKQDYENHRINNLLLDYLVNKNSFQNKSKQIMKKFKNFLTIKLFRVLLWIKLLL